MFHKILVAINRVPSGAATPTAMGQQVFNAALDLAKSSHAGLKLLHVLALSEPDNPTMAISNSQGYLSWLNSATSQQAYEQMWEDYEAKSMELLRSFASQANDVGVKAEVYQCSGAAGSTICELAIAWGADLIVLGRQGHSGVGELVLGSVSNYVVHHAHCSVLTVQGHTQDRPEQDRVGSVAIGH